MSLTESLEQFPASPLGAHAAIAKLARRETRSQTVDQRLARLEAERDLRDFIYDFAYLYDAKEFDALMEIYADDCVLVNTSGTYEGVEAIRRIQRHDLPGTEISFHHLGNVRVAVDDDNRGGWVAAYMYNMAIREQEPYGTVATLLVRAARDGNDGRWRAKAFRIAIDSRHNLPPREMKIVSNPLASRPRTSADLVGQHPRFPTAAGVRA